MQTFLPYPNFSASASCLDWRRLGSQRNEAHVLYFATVPGTTFGGSWRNHPAALMWKDHRPALALYLSIVLMEWERRGYANSGARPYDRHFQPVGQDVYGELPPVSEIVMPSWLGDPAFHAAHRSSLLRKDPQWYGQFGWTDATDLPYVWPVRRLEHAG